MKLVKHLVPIWIVSIIMIGAGAILYPQMDGATLPDLLLPISSSLLGILSLFLHSSERRRGARLVFLNFALFFGINGLSRCIYQFAMRWLSVCDPWIDFYFYVYNWLLYILLLSLAVLFLVVDHMFRNGSAWRKMLVSIVAVLGIWLSMFYPFLLDAKYLYKVPDYLNFKAVQETIADLHGRGISNPTSRQIAEIVQFEDSNKQLAERMPLDVRQSYVEQLQAYLTGSNYAVLIFKPLWIRCSWVSMISLLIVVTCIVLDYFVDSPKGAYMEKILWCLLPYCGFEALHLSLYSRMTSWDHFGEILDVGAWLSMGVIWLLILLVGLRLHFVKSVEGDYYERRLVADANGITRWRDSFDDWIVKQFMNPGELDRRFLTQRQREEQGQP